MKNKTNYIQEIFLGYSVFITTVAEETSGSELTSLLYYKPTKILHSPVWQQKCNGQGETYCRFVLSTLAFYVLNIVCPNRVIIRIIMCTFILEFNCTLVLFSKVINDINNGPLLSLHVFSVWRVHITVSDVSHWHIEIWWSWIKFCKKSVVLPHLQLNVVEHQLQERKRLIHLNLQCWMFQLVW